MDGVDCTLRSKSDSKLMPKNWLFNDSLRMYLRNVFVFEQKELILLWCNLLDTSPSKHQNINSQNFSLMYIVNIYYIFILIRRITLKYIYFIDSQITYVSCFLHSNLIRIRQIVQITREILWYLCARHIALQMTSRYSTHLIW